MSLPEILEMDPWLEDEEENYLKAEDSYLKSQNYEEGEKEKQGYNVLGTIITVVKISFNSYLVFKLVSRSSTIRSIFWVSMKQPGKFGALLFILGTLLLGITNIKRKLGR